MNFPCYFLSLWERNGSTFALTPLVLVEPKLPRMQPIIPGGAMRPRVARGKTLAGAAHRGNQELLDHSMTFQTTLDDVGSEQVLGGFMM